MPSVTDHILKNLSFGKFKHFENHDIPFLLSLIYIHWIDAFLEEVS